MYAEFEPYISYLTLIYFFSLCLNLMNHLRLLEPKKKNKKRFFSIFYLFIEFQPMTLTSDNCALYHHA